MAKILLIDDSESFLAHVAQMLAAGGHEVVATSSSATGARHLLEHDVDLLITDLYMPPPDGFEIMQAARSLGRPLPIVVMSTNPLACDVFRAARALGAMDSLQKPFKAEKLLATVDRVLADAADPAPTRPDR